MPGTIQPGSPWEEKLACEVRPVPLNKWGVRERACNFSTWRPRQEDYYEFKASLCYTVCFMPAWLYKKTSCSMITRKRLALEVEASVPLPSVVFPRLDGLR